jgi:hypothetical protein
MADYMRNPGNGAQNGMTVKTADIAHMEPPPNSHWHVKQNAYKSHSYDPLNLNKEA